MEHKSALTVGQMIGRGILAMSLITVFSAGGCIISSALLGFQAAYWLSATSNPTALEKAIRKISGSPTQRRCCCSRTSPLQAVRTLALFTIAAAAVEFLAFLATGAVVWSDVAGETIHRCTIITIFPGVHSCFTAHYTPSSYLWLVFAAGSTSLGAMHNIIWSAVNLHLVSRMCAFDSSSHVASPDTHSTAHPAGMHPAFTPTATASFAYAGHGRHLQHMADSTADAADAAVFAAGASASAQYQPGYSHSVSTMTQPSTADKRTAFQQMHVEERAQLHVARQASIAHGHGYLPIAAQDAV